MLLDGTPRPLQAVNGLRLLLLHPPLPVPHSQGLLERATILDDLALFTTHLRRTRVTVSLEVPAQYVVCMFMCSCM